MPAVIALRFLGVDFSNIKIQQALLAGGLVATGWIVTFGLRELQVYLERRQKSIDLQYALRGEIYDYSEMFDDGNVDDIIQELENRLKEKDGVNPPFFPLISEPVVFNNLVSEIYFLPQNVIDDVVQFYSMLSDVRLLAEDFRTDPFIELSNAGKLDAYGDFVELRENIRKHGLDTVAMLNKCLRVREDALPFPKMELPRYDEQKAVLEQWLNSQISDREGL